MSENIRGAWKGIAAHKRPSTQHILEYVLVSAMTALRDGLTTFKKVRAPRNHAVKKIRKSISEYF